MDKQKITDYELYELSGVHFNVIKLIRTGQRKKHHDLKLCEN
uniref:Uncharacterized protein n=1 Tax=Siphoviridae sp. ctSP74 TaxID=2826343 RepID=A0A8S5NPF9_9CAUD|nr:MAG TPA: hypothetical protein [Siphoviridae sp. ctSP74]